MTSKCCDGRTGERICKTKFLIPLILLIVAIQVALWYFVIGPKFFDYGNDAVPGNEKMEFVQESDGKVPEDSDEDQNEDYKDWKTTENPSILSSTMETTEESATSMEQLFSRSLANYEEKILEKLRRPHKHRHKNRYFIRRKEHGSHSSPPTTPTTRPSTTTTTTTQKPYWAETIKVVATTRQIFHERHHPTTQTTTTKAASTPAEPANKHHSHFQKPNQEEELAKKQEMERRRQEEDREQERMRVLAEERERLRLTEEQEKRAQAIYEAQQNELKKRKEEAARKKGQDEETLRRMEHEKRLREWEEEERRRQTTTTTKYPENPRESNQFHHPRTDHRQDVADPWAHLRQLHEQRANTVTVMPSTKLPGLQRVDTNEVDPFQITKHDVEESSQVWRGHVDHRRTHENKAEHERHHQKNEEARRMQEEKLREAERLRQIEEHRRRHEEERRKQEEERRRIHEERRKQEEERQQRERADAARQHHHHSIQGAAIPDQKNVHFGHHSHHKHQHVEVPPEKQEISNDIAVATNPEDRDKAPVIVTALLDIGRGDWHRFTRPYDLYLDYLLDLLKLQNRMIIFGDRAVVEFLQSQGDKIDPSRLQLVEISLQDLPFYRYRQEMDEIMKQEQENWKDSWEKATKTHPEAINPDYNILVNSKPYLLYNATQISRFNSEFFIWLDAGYSHGQKNLIPPILWNPKLPNNKITAIKITGEQDKVKNYNIDHVYRKQWTVMSGGILAGDAPTIDRFRRFYHKTFMDILDSRKTDDDQTTLLITAANYHSLFHILHGGWFDAFKLLPNQ